MRQLFAALLVIGITMAGSTQIKAASGIWTNLTTGNWSDSTMWLGGTVGDGIDSTAQFATNIAAITYVTNDTARTIGHLVFRDTATTFFSWTLTGTQAVTMQVTAGSPTIAVTNTASFIECPLAGTQGFTKRGTVGLSLLGTNTISGVVTNLAGALTFTNGTTPNLTGLAHVAGTVSILNGATVGVAGNIVAPTGANMIISNATLNVTGGGNVFLATNGAATTASHILAGGILNVGSGGTLQLGNNAASGSSTVTLNVDGAVTNNSALYCGRPGVINLRSGASWVQTGDMSLNGQGGFAALMNVISGSTLTYSGANTIKLNPALDNNGRAALTLGGSLTTSQGFQRTVGGSGGGQGQLIFTGGTITLAANISQFTAGTLVLSNGTGGCTFDTAGYSTAIGAVIVGPGADTFTKQGAGTLSLNAANTFLGDLVISAGAVQLGDGATLNGSVAGNIQDNSALVFANPFNLTYGGAISGTGTLTKQAAGALTLINAQTYTGTTAVTGGRLNVNGALDAASAVSVATNATLGGMGTAGGVTVAAGGTVEGGVGGSGVLTLANLTFSGSATLSAAVDPVNAPIVVSGTLDSGSSGSIVVNVLNTPAPGTTNHIIQFATLAGTAPITIPISRAFTLATNGNYIDLIVAPTFDSALWTGASSTEWSSATIASPKNWKLFAAGTPTDFINLDSTVFDDTCSNATVNVYVTSVNPASMTFSNATVNYTLQGSQSIAGGTLTKTGIGSLAINSTNSFTGLVNLKGGTTTVPYVANTGVSSPLGAGANIAFDGGTLEVTSASSMNRGVTFDAGGGTLAVNNPLTLSGVLGGAGTMTKSGSSTLTLTAANAHSGTVLNSGRLEIGNNAALGTGALTLNGGTIASDSLTARSVANSLNFNGSFTVSDTNVPAALTLGVTGNPNTLLTNSTIHVPTALGISQVIDGVIDDGASSFTLTKTGPGDLRLQANNNTWDGGLIIQGGRVSPATGAYGTGPVYVSPGAQAYCNGFPGTYNNVFYLSGIGPEVNGGFGGALLINFSATIPGTGAIVLEGNARITSDPNATTVNAPISETNGSWALEIGGSNIATNNATNGTIQLNGAGTHSGGTSVAKHRLIAGNTALFGTGSVTVNPHGQVYLGVAGEFTNTFNIEGSGWTGDTAPIGAIRLAANTISGPINIKGPGTRITAYNSVGNLLGPIGETNGSWGLEYGYTSPLPTAYAGIITVSNNNTYTGGTGITNAVVTVATDGAFGPGPVGLGSPNSKLTRILLNDAVTVSNSLTIGGSLFYGVAGRGALEASATSTSTWSGPIDISVTPSGGGHLYTPADSQLTLSGSVTSSVSIIERDGVVVWSGGGSYPSLTVSAGIAKVGANNGICPTATLTLAGSSAATNDLNGFNQTYAGLTEVVGGVVLNDGAAPSTLTLDIAGTNLFGGVIQDGLNTVSLVKQGAGILNLTNASTYTGATVVSNGVLLVNGSLGLTPVTVSGGMLGGTGAVAGVVSVGPLGTFAPGASIGVITVTSNLVLTGTTSIEVDKGNGTNDMVTGLNSVTYGGTLAVNNLSGTLNVGDSFPVFSAASSSGNFAGITGSPGGGNAWSFNPATGVLSVVGGGVNTTPTNIVSSVSGGNLNLSWPSDYTGWRLLVQTNLRSIGLVAPTNAWFTWPGSAATNAVSIPINPANPTVFYRLVYP